MNDELLHKIIGIANYPCYIVVWLLCSHKKECTRLEDGKDKEYSNFKMYLYIKRDGKISFF